jgi:hypothetical protein
VEEAKATQKMQGKFQSTKHLFLVVLNVLLFIQGGRVMVFNATFNNISVISWLSVLLVEETRVLGENH